MDDDADATTTPPADKQVCNLVDCVNYGSGGSGGISPNCREVNNGQTLVGCGGTNEITGSKSTAFGYQAGSSGSEGQKNTFIGYQAGKKITTGTDNVFLGYLAGSAVKTNSYNTLIGSNAGSSLTGGGNTLIGYNAGLSLIGAGNNIFIGNGAGPDVTSGGYNIMLGSDKTLPSLTGSRQMNLGNLILGKQPSGALTFDSTASSMSDGEVRVLGGPLKICDSGGGNCTEVASIHSHPYAPSSHGHSGYASSGHGHSGLQNLSSTITATVNNLTSTITATVRNLQSSVTSNSNTIDSNLGYARDVQINLNNHIGSNSAHGLSSRVYKKNITPYSDLDKSLKHIVDTPLFTYQYKKDHPNKTRMGIISEELPSFFTDQSAGCEGQSRRDSYL